MTDTAPILRTKLYRPPLPEAWVERPRLHKQLTAGFSKPLTLVSAAAGYGKTTLVSSSLEETELAHAWLSLDENDNDLITFLTYFIAAIQTIFPKACLDTQTLLKASNPPPLPDMTHSLVNELDEIETTFILVLDDFQFILQTTIHDLLNDLLRHPPRPLHLVLITRRDPSLAFTRLRAKDLMTEIRSKRLRFTVAETAAFLKVSHGFDPDDATVSALAKTTEGWVTGLLLALLSVRGERDPARILQQISKKTDMNITEYLMTEVVSSLDKPIQEFLMKTSILDWLDGPLCDAVAGLDEPVCDGQAYLEWLYKANFFTLPHGDDRETYRYHHLFQAHLQQELMRTFSQDEIADLHRRASAWYAEAGFIDDGIHHALAAGDTLAAARIVEDHRFAPLASGHWPRLRMWLDQLPDDIVQQRPELLLSSAWVANYEGAYELIPPIMQTIDDLIKTETIERQIQGELDFFNGLLLFWETQIEGSLELFRSAVKQIPGSHSGVRNEPEIYLATAGQMAGQGKTIARAYRLKAQRETEDIFRKNYLKASLVFVYLFSGNLRLASEAAQEIGAQLGDTDFALGRGWGFYLQGYVQFAWNHLEKATQFFARALEDRYSLDINSPIDSYAGLMLSYQAMGQADEAGQTASEMLNFARKSNNPLHLILARSAEARLALAQGDVAWAVRWLETADIATDAGPMFFFIDQPRMTRCHVLVAQGTDASLRTAEKELQKFWQLCEATHNTPRMIEIALLQAQIDYKRDRLAQALDRLEEAVRVGLQGGFIRPFLDGGPMIAELLDQLIEREVSVDYVSQILAAFAEAGTLPRRRDPNQDLREPLTKRELETVRLLATGLTINEIADDLHVSIVTVRTHSKNIYSKLDVHSRMQAAQRASELGLV